VARQEVAYYFPALVLGLLNGLGVPDRGLVVAMNVVLLLAMLASTARISTPSSGSAMRSAAMPVAEMCRTRMPSITAGSLAELLVWDPGDDPTP
jgi:hypothetical protein